MQSLQYWVYFQSSFFFFFFYTRPKNKLEYEKLRVLTNLIRHFIQITAVTLNKYHREMTFDAKILTRSAKNSG